MLKNSLILALLLGSNNLLGACCGLLGAAKKGQLMAFYQIPTAREDDLSLRGGVFHFFHNFEVAELVVASQTFIAVPANLIPKGICLDAKKVLIPGVGRLMRKYSNRVADDLGLAAHMPIVFGTLAQQAEIIGYLSEPKKL